MIIFTITAQILKGSSNAFSRRILKKYPLEPMMKQREIRIIEEIILNLKPINVLEWGSGYSTVYFPRFTSEKSNWLAIEHDKKWFKIIEKKVRRATIKFISPNDKNYNKKKGDGTYREFRNYIEYPKTLKKKYDLIIVDGRAREECLKVAIKLLNKNGVIILHDANRKKYYSKLNFPQSKTKRFFDQSENHGGILIYKEENVGKLINIRKHSKIWKTYRTLGKIPVFGPLILKIS